MSPLWCMVLGVGLMGWRSGLKAGSLRGEISMTGNGPREARMKKALFVLSLVGLWLWLTPVEAQPKRKLVSVFRSRRLMSCTSPHTSPTKWAFSAENNIEVEFVTFEGGTQTLAAASPAGSISPAIARSRDCRGGRGAGTKVVGTYSHKLSQSMLVQVISKLQRPERTQVAITARLITSLNAPTSWIPILRPFRSLQLLISP